MFISIEKKKKKSGSTLTLIVYDVYGLGEFVKDWIIFDLTGLFSFTSKQ